MGLHEPSAIPNSSAQNARTPRATPSATRTPTTIETAQPTPGPTQHPHTLATASRPTALAGSPSIRLHCKPRPQLPILCRP